MAILDFSLRRLLLAGGFAVAVAAAPAIGAVAGPAAEPLRSLAEECREGEEVDVYTGNCVPHTAPVKAPPKPPNPGFGSIPGNPDVPQIGGIPCTGTNTGQCIGLAESQSTGSAPPPKSTVGHSPTVHGRS